MAEMKFEDALGKLEEIVEKLEDGDVGLEESIKLFEEGMNLYKTCVKKLEDAQGRIQKLMRDKEGNFKLDSLKDEKE